MFCFFLFDAKYEKRHTKEKGQISMMEYVREAAEPLHLQSPFFVDIKQHQKKKKKERERHSFSLDCDT